MVHKFVHGLLGVGLAAIGVGTIGVLPAGASRATTVVSDKITWSGTVTKTSTGYSIKSTQCSLVSDGETTPFTCAIAGSFNSSGAGTATLVSKDGKSHFSFTLTPTSTGFALAGKGKEADAADPGQPPPTPYPCTIKGTVTPTGATTFSSSLTVSESSTAP